MKKCTVIGFIFGMIYVTGCGQPTYQQQKAPVAVGAVMKNIAENNNQDIGNVIEVMEDIEISAKENSSDELKSYHLVAGDTFTVIQKKMENNQEYALIYIEDADQTDNLQQAVWVPTKELLNAKMQVADLEDPFDDNGEEKAEINSDKFIALAAAVSKKSRKRSGSGRGKRRMTYCYRFVKIRLQQLGLVKGYLPGGSAKNAYSLLPRYGFHSTGGGPSGAGINDVCVYSGGNGGHGHIEIRVSGGWWYGYGVKSSSISLSNHRLLGCFGK
ncbi:MAG: hypothetical protein H6623_01375 [Bdellovibrionaceae bacterium]|nr:hypothetical protein [Pseudobdellovibrionaceae bacterium]